MINLSEIFKKEGLEFFNREKFSLDNYTAPDYQDQDEEIDSSLIFESHHSDQSFRELKLINFDAGLFKYFLDGSRKVYLLGEFISADNKYLPILAGQIATACCERINKNMKKFMMKRSNVIAFPRRINEETLENIETNILSKIKDSNFFKMISDEIKWEILKYDLGTSQNNVNVKIEDKGTAKIQEVMQSYEVEMIQTIAEKGLLQENSILVIDGSLRFERQTKKMQPKCFRNVIAVAKSFDPHKTKLLKRKNKEIGTYLKDLKFAYRTPVFMVENYHKTMRYGTWYVRIRQKNQWKNPLDGIVKIEKLATTDFEHENGFDSNLIDNISTCILAERNPTCYGNDKRWASHLYPIYLTEKLVKSSFLSDTFFLNIF